MKVLSQLQQFESHHRIATSITYSFVGAFFEQISLLCVKFLTNIPAVQVLVLNSIVAVVLLNFVIKNYEIQCYPKRQIIYKLIFRGILGSIDEVVLFSSVKLITISESIVLTRTHPLRTLFLAVFILKREKLQIKSLVNIFICMLGVIMIARPPYIQKLFDQIISSQENEDQTTHTLGVIFALSSAMLTAFIQIVVNKLGSNVNQLTIVQYYEVITIVSPTIYQMYSPFGDFEMPTIIQWMILFCGALASCLGQVLMSKSFALGDLTQMSLTWQSGIIYGLLFDIFIIHQSFHPLSIAGLVLVVGSLIFVILQKKE